MTAAAFRRGGITAAFSLARISGIRDGIFGIRKSLVTKQVTPSPDQRALYVLIAVASFLLYAVGVLALHQDKMAGWALEAEGSLPVAVSHLVYGRPLGAVDQNIFQPLERSIMRTPQQEDEKFSHPDGSTVQHALAMVARGTIPPGQLTMDGTHDGVGVGSNLFGTLAMWLFGIRLSSIILFYLGFVGVSVCAFVLRFRDQRLLILSVYFLAVTIMLLTPLCTSAEGVAQTPIGGNRYFVLAALLPAMHIVFEITEGRDPNASQRKVADMLALFVQAILLFAALLVRSAASYVLGALLIVFIYRLYKVRRERESVISLGGAGVIVAAAFGFWAIFVVAASPSYVNTGRALGNFWHRAVRSFDMHPEWPFDNLSQVYDCRNYAAGGLGAVRGDGTPQCIWFAYPPNRYRPVPDLGSGLFSSKYDKVLRQAYFYILTHYPRQAFQLYTEIKSQRIGDTLGHSWHYLTELNDAPVAMPLFIIVTGQVILFIAAAIFTGRQLPDRNMFIIPVFFLLSITPRYIAWSSMTTDIEMICLFYGTLAVGALFLIKFCLNVAPALTGNVTD
jgi:hypothetical protein